MNEEPKKSELSTLNHGIADYVTSAAKSVLGAFPVAGSLLSELAGTVIPNQRIDRIAKFAGELEKRLANNERDVIRALLTNENFTDFFEEEIRQAIHAATDERRSYLASLILNGITNDEADFIKSKHLLRILGEINDAEVLWLRYHLVTTPAIDAEFKRKHEHIFGIAPASAGCSQAVRDKNVMRASYLQHLTRLDLLTSRSTTIIDDGGGAADSPEPSLEATQLGDINASRDDRLTALGDLFLRHIGLGPSK